ncbi:MAG: sugar phosphate isomerase/epimerase [Chthonomonadales bacterium]|nr:sugar phosphate isomerase/epimerase [Chthonomonadales bacterium]
MKLPRAAVQLIVFGERNRSDIAGVLSDVRTAGFDAIEAGNLFAAHGEDAVRSLLGHHAVTVCGAHFGYGDYADSSKLAQNIAYCKALGVQHMMCSGVSDTKSVAGYVESAKLFNTVGTRLRDEGLVFNYHNHAWEFEDLGGTNGMAILDAETDPAVVKFNIDVFWVTIGGASPAEFIRQHAERAGYFHFKDGRRTADGGVEFLELGAGEVDLEGSMAAAREAGATWIVAEQDSTKLPHLESVTVSRRYLSERLGI